MPKQLTKVTLKKLWGRNESYDKDPMLLQQHGAQLTVSRALSQPRSPKYLLPFCSRFVLSSGHLQVWLSLPLVRTEAIHYHRAFLFFNNLDPKQ
jgi:hypothetical protein